MSFLADNLKYTHSHEWLGIDTDTIVTGITEHAQSLLGDMVFVELPEIGAEFSRGDEMGVLESVKTAADFYAPISGMVIAVNTQINNNPALINHDPYGAGWLVKFKAYDNSEIASLLNATEYQKILIEEH